MAAIINGREIAEREKKRIKRRIASLGNPDIGLAIVQVGNDPASNIYVSKKIEAAGEVGIRAVHVHLNNDISEDELIEKIEQLNRDERITGMIVQLPLAKGMNTQRVVESVRAEKDADGFTSLNMGKLFAGISGVIPATPKGIMKLIEETGIDIEGKKAVVVGRSNIVGKPAAMLLLRRNATVTICHSRTRELGRITREADILVVAVGKAGLIKKEMVKEGAVVIDVGTNRVDGKLVGDVDDDVGEVAGFITPVPGGVGPMTVTMLLENTLELFEKNKGG